MLGTHTGTSGYCAMWLECFKNCPPLPNPWKGGAVLGMEKSPGPTSLAPGKAHELEATRGEKRPICSDLAGALWKRCLLGRLRVVFRQPSPPPHPHPYDALLSKGCGPHGPNPRAVGTGPVGVGDPRGGSHRPGLGFLSVLPLSPSGGLFWGLTKWPQMFLSGSRQGGSFQQSRGYARPLETRQWDM